MVYFLSTTYRMLCGLLIRSNLILIISTNYVCWQCQCTAVQFVSPTLRHSNLQSPGGTNISEKLYQDQYCSNLIIPLEWFHLERARITQVERVCTSTNNLSSFTSSFKLVDAAEVQQLTADLDGNDKDFINQFGYSLKDDVKDAFHLRLISMLLLKK